MYILKNAWKSIVRSKGRNILIGVIVLVIALSSCVALSIRQAAEQARESSLDTLEITARITMNRQAMMSGQQDRESMREAMMNMEEISLEEMRQYGESEYVKDFYYTVSASMNGGGDIEAVDTTGITDTEETENAEEETNADEQAPAGQGMFGDMPGNEGMMGGGGQDMMGGRGGRMGLQGDFTVTGYSTDAAMTAFLKGTNHIVSGEMFAQNDTDMGCVISEELASYNGLEAGDEIILTNPNNEEETYTFIINGIYQNEETGDSAENMMGGFSAAFDRANQIYTSYENVKSVADASEAAAEVTTDELTGREISTALRVQESGTYIFSDVESYEAFKEETEEALGEYYTVTSTDVNAYEQSLVPLENLSSYAGYFLVIILVIGGIILVVLNLFSIRERKYEIGVLAAIGMKKGKIAVQFVLELLCVTFAAIFIGTAAGAAVSVPVTNQLLARQIESSTQTVEQQDMNFGREAKNTDIGGMRGGPGNMPEGMPGMANGEPGKGMRYVDRISSAANLTVALQLAAIGILLTVISGCVAVVSILKYDPLRILSSRD